MTGSQPFSIESSDLASGGSLRTIFAGKGHATCGLPLRSFCPIHPCYCYHFRRSFKKLKKVIKPHLEKIGDELEGLIINPYPNKSRREPLPGKLKLPEEWTFHKLEIRIAKGASGQIRIMYLVNETTSTIQLVWIYSHEQFTKRPADGDIQVAISEILQ
jgi:mRNA-degrading endonuclease RelE of RelBE toxin-antitoxin system